jgi:hypothetical protein
MKNHKLNKRMSSARARLLYILIRAQRCQTGDVMNEPSGSTDWSAAYAHYLLRAAQQTARTQSLYYLVLQRVSRGELSPAALRDALATFAERRGADYGSRVADASARFFSGLVQIAAGASTPPPPYDAADPYGWYQRLASYTADIQRRSVDAYRERLERAARESSSAPIGDEYTRRAGEQVSALGRLYFELLERVVEIGAASEEEYLGIVLSGATPTDSGAPVVELKAPLGTSASAVVSLENTRPDRAVIRCTVSEVRRADGVGPSFLPNVLVDPDGLMLEPEQEGSVRLSLALDPEVYAPAADYVGAVQVLRHGEPRLDLPLRIRAAAPVGAETP